MSFEFMSNPNYNGYGMMGPTGMQAPTYPEYGQMMQPPVMGGQQPQMMAQQQQPKVDPRIYDTPQIVSGGTMKPRFTIKKDPSFDPGDTTIIPVDRDISDMEKEAAKKGKGKPRKETGESTSIVRAGDTPATPVTGTVENSPTIYSYGETTNMLHQTLGQIDGVNAALLQEFESIRHNRTLKNKYNILTGLSENISALIGTRVQVIKELNSTISKSNDMDYKREKDMKASMAAVDDDKYIADLYKSFIANPVNVAPTPQLPQVDPSIFGSGIVRADLGGTTPMNGVNIDTSYLSYMSNLSPEQNLMRYESNPNVKQVVVFDAASGNRFFQMMDVVTGAVIPNVPVYDPMFLEDTTLDLKNKIAKNINLNETFPIIVINEGVTQQY